MTAILDDLRGSLADDEILEVSPALLTDQTGVLPAGPVAAVVAPRSVAGVQQVARIATAHRAPLVVRGAGTGLSGGAVATAGGIVLSTERLDEVRIDADDQVAVVGPGAITDRIDRAARAHGLMYAPDPASSERSSIGGNVATGAGGLRCVKYGVTRDAVLALDVVLADGELIHTGHRTVKGVTGLDLTALFVGSEGTLGIVVGATLRLVPAPLAERSLVVSAASLEEAGRAVAAVTSAGVRPSCVELLDRGTLENIDEHSGTRLAQTHGEALLLVRTDGAGADAELDRIVRALAREGLTADVLTDDEGARYAELRRTGRGPRAGMWKIGEDMAVPRSQLIPALEALREIGRTHDVRTEVVAHAGAGNLHPLLYTPRGDGETEPPRRLLDAADALVRRALALGGTLSGEHGIGRAKRPWLADELGPAQLELQRAIKRVFDPLGILAPDGFLSDDDAAPALTRDEVPA
ncbi:MAG TPA: FAD-linked oxidase C-terminal domain-containing protein [Microbacterium sp.]|nr:FAD-linked oxidase C-terminal domain-containing protein [Microbacterium sp.]